MVSGRVAELEAVDDSPDESRSAPQSVVDSTYAQSPRQPEPADEGSLAGIGYSVTDGVAVIAELRE